MTPLQTHGLFEKKWHPPRNTRFVSYSQKDEAWAAPLGIGSFTHEPAAYYDVRLDGPDLKLVGYATANPCKYWSQGSIEVAIVEANDDRSFLRPPAMMSLRPAITTVRVYSMPVMIANQERVCWMVDNPLDAAKLVLSGWVKLFGEDNLHCHAAELRRQQYRMLGDPFLRSRATR